MERSEQAEIKDRRRKIIRAEGAGVGYHGKTLIGDLSFSIRRGEIVSLIGPNGAGKSTILKSLTKQLALISGTVFLNGKDLSAMSAASVAGKMAVLLTEKVKEGYLTAFDVAAMGRYPYTGRMGILSDEDRNKTKKALDAVEALELASRPFAELSDGQKQRVLLARALAQEPEVLVLDEPTTYLDVRYQMKLMDLLLLLARKQNITVIVSLHEIEQAARISDRILMVRGDRTVRIGTPEEIFGSGEIETLFNLEPGRYDPLLGSAELMKAEGEPEIFVISSGGTGIPVYRKLARKGTPFAAGILYENDMDTRFALRMAAKVITEKPFLPVSDPAFLEAERVMRHCGKVVNAGIQIGTINQRVEDLLKEAEESGMLLNL